MLNVKDSASLKGRFEVTILRADGTKEEIIVNNGITDAARNRLLDIMFHGTTQIVSWYVGLISNTSYTAVAAGDTYTSHAGWLENTSYTESVRQAWDETAAATQSITSNTQATFTASTTTEVKGMFIASSNVKDETTGSALLWSTAVFNTVRTLAAGDQLKISYTISD